MTDETRNVGEGQSTGRDDPPTNTAFGYRSARLSPGSRNTAVGPFPDEPSARVTFDHSDAETVEMLVFSEWPISVTARSLPTIAKLLALGIVGVEDEYEGPQSRVHNEKRPELEAIHAQLTTPARIEPPSDGE
jgi:hypothetical protein